MLGYGPSTYGDRIAEVYDALYAGLDPQEAVATLAELADGGRVLELGIGTGRIALPLAAKGIDVHGIDASEAMVARLRAKPGSDRISVTMGDFAEVNVEGTFSLIFVAFNTFFGLLTQDDQVRCFQNVARHLNNDGVFLIEAFVPDPSRFMRGQNTQTTFITPDEVRLKVSRHDLLSQQVVSQHIHISETGTKLYPGQIPTPIPPSSTSWRGLPACVFATVGAAGAASRSPFPVHRTSLFTDTNCERVYLILTLSRQGSGNWPRGGETFRRGLQEVSGASGASSAPTPRHPKR